MPFPLRTPPFLLLAPTVRLALEEDLGRAGDLTSDLVLPAGQRATALLVARKAGTISGLVVAEAAFHILDGALKVRLEARDGHHVAAGTPLLAVQGFARSILAAERVALNFVGHLSGVATATRALVDAVKGTKARIVCTRKTTPGLRVLEKYAVRCGGGLNHRYGLDDAVLIKDNHIVAAGGIKNAVERVFNSLGHMVKVEVEVDTLEQLAITLELGVDTVLLDNMGPDMLREAVKLPAGRAALEASGNVTLETVRAIADTGVDYISSGSITHSAPSLDVALDF